MSQFNLPPDIAKYIAGLSERLANLERQRFSPPSHTTAELAGLSPSAGMVIFVTDASAGKHFQGWTGTEWVILG
jgi:hypothetical protein